MATLVLTAAGTALGGPIGGAIGALIGQQADAAIFAPKPRQGPRLGELAVQTSSYGTSIPKVFGRMRVAGTVIWATDLKERRSTSGGGKGQPKTTSYSYSASFAVALSGRPIKQVNRIWADGKLFRGAAGDFKSRTKYRLYPGGEDQAADPLIASAEGIGQAPAFRGIAYAMFEDLELADYGNRIPSLTFEVVAEDAPVSIAEIAAELSQGAVVAGDSMKLAGYAASGDSLGGAIATLLDVVPLSLQDRAGTLALRAAAGEPVPVAGADEEARAGNGGGRTEILRRGSGAIPAEITITYYDAARDYQTGLQRVAKGEGNRAEQRALPAVLTPADAKAMAQHRLATLLAGRLSAKVHLPPRFIGLGAGDHVRFGAREGLWKVVRRTVGAAGLVSLELVKRPPEPRAIDTRADSGRPIENPDLRIGPTTLRLFDLPLYDEPLAQGRLFAMAAGAEAGWRRADLMASYDGGASWSSAGSTAAPAVLGQAVSVLGAAGSAIMDLRNAVEVELLNDAMWLESRGEASLMGGANLAILADELFQFGHVEALGDRRFRLSKLLRGRRGTEWAASLHAAGDVFALVEPETITIIEPPLASADAQMWLSAIGTEDPASVQVHRAAMVEAVRPPSPVHLKAERRANGDIALSWVRRSRSGWAWTSGSDTPLGEEVEAYSLTISGQGVERNFVLHQPAYVYGAAAQAADGNNGPLNISVAQLGTVASSRFTTTQQI